MMPSTSPWYRLFVFSVVLFSCLISFASAIDDPNEAYSMGITPYATSITQGNAETQSWESLLFTTILQYDQDTSKIISDDELVGIASHAWDEMVALHSANKDRCTDGRRWIQVPSAIAAMAIGNKIYISSSFAGRVKEARQNLVYVGLRDTKLTQLLNACQAELQSLDPATDVPHRHRQFATCAEIFTVQQYLDHNNNNSPKDTPGDVRKRIAAWGTSYRDSTRARAIPACDVNTGQQGTWGCKEFMESLGVDTMDKVIQLYNLGTTGMPPKPAARPIPLEGQISVNLQDAVNAPRVPGS